MNLGQNPRNCEITSVIPKGGLDTVFIPSWHTACETEGTSKAVCHGGRVENAK